MRRTYLLLAAVAFLSFTTVQAEEYGFDKAHTHIGFTVQHLLTKVPGEFRDFDGSFTFDPNKPEASSISVTIQAASVNTDNDRRDHHLQSADFFDVEKFPTLTFNSTSVSKGDGDNKYDVVGDLTIHGVTKPVTLGVEYLGSDTQAMGKDNKMVAKIAGFSATTKIDRRDFGLTWGEGMMSTGKNMMVANDVTINLDIAAMDKKSLEKMAAMMQKMNKAKPASN
jgi:polyisoprenoid-binding protein YceI